MAVVKIVNNPCDTNYALENLCAYVVRYDRTLGFVGGRGLRPSCAVAAMNETMELWDKKFGRRAYHIVISFADELVIMPDEAMEIAYEVSSFFFPVYQVLWGVHREQDHMHIHFAVCTTSLLNGLKMHIDFELKRKLDLAVESIVQRYVY